MPRKSAEELIEELAISVGRGFAEVHDDIAAVRRELKEEMQAIHQKLDRVEFLVTGQDQRISTLEDRMRQVATKLGLTFN